MFLNNSATRFDLKSVPGVLILGWELVHQTSVSDLQKQCRDSTRRYFWMSVAVFFLVAAACHLTYWWLTGYTYRTTAWWATTLVLDAVIVTSSWMYCMILKPDDCMKVMGKFMNDVHRALTFLNWRWRYGGDVMHRHDYANLPEFIQVKLAGLENQKNSVTANREHELAIEILSPFDLIDGNVPQAQTPAQSLHSVQPGALQAQ